MRTLWLAVTVAVAAAGIGLTVSTPSHAALGDPEKGRTSGQIREINVHDPAGKSARIDFHVVADGPIQYVRMGPGCGPVRWELLPVLRALKADGTATTFEGKKLSDRTICLEYMRL